MFQKILVPLDGSELAEQALSPAVALSRAENSELIMLSVPVLKQMMVRERAGYGFLWPEDSLRYSRRELTAYLQGLEEANARSGLSLRAEIRDGDAAGVIVDTAMAENVDLIVMSTHGRSGLSRWVLGSVTEKVLRQAPCPVLVIRDKKPFAHMLIPIDGSQLSEFALGPGFEVSRRLGSHVTLFSVEQAEDIDPQFIAELERTEKGLGQHARDDFYHRTETYLQNVALKYQPQIEQEIQIAPRSTAPVAQSILDFVEANDIDLVVMSTHGRTGLRRWVYGSVTEKVLRSAHCAMLIVRPPAHALA